MAGLQEALNVKEQIIREYLRSPADWKGSAPPEAISLALNIVGVGVGWLALEQGFETENWVVRVYVARKLPPKMLDELLLPHDRQGVRIDVVESGKFRAM